MTGDSYAVSDPNLLFNTIFCDNYTFWASDLVSSGFKLGRLCNDSFALRKHPLPDLTTIARFWAHPFVVTVGRFESTFVIPTTCTHIWLCLRCVARHVPTKSQSPTSLNCGIARLASVIPHGAISFTDPCYFELQGPFRPLGHPGFGPNSDI